MGDLSPHFSTREFRSRDGADLPRRHRRKIKNLCVSILEPMRREWGACQIVSGHRSVRHNLDVGGVGDSMHLDRRGRLGAAADVRFATGTPTEWAAHANRLGAGGVGIYTDTVHIDTRSGTARW